LDYKKNAGIDLHIHSNASDGTFSPYEILCHAGKLGLKAISITDHDTLDGSKEALRIGIPSSLKFLTGVEISTALPPDFEHTGSCHILGYLISIDNPALNETLRVLQVARKNRNPKIIKQLNALNVDITLEEVINNTIERQVGRPHIARIMAKKGIVTSINEAFDKYLGQGRPAYVDKYRIDCAKAIEVILNSGGIPVLAHPFLLKQNKGQPFENLIKLLKTMGLMGMEIYYPDHSPDLIAYYTKIANRFGLLITGGTDFHGALKPDIQMGSGNGNLIIPYELYEKLITAKKSRPYQPSF